MPKLRILLLAALLFLTGCAAAASGGVAKAVVPENSVDFGNVPVSNNMKDTRNQQFVIRNAGTGDLKLSRLQVKTLEGC